MHLSAANPFPCEARDVNGDGLDDLICHVQTSQMNLPMGVSTADLVVRTHDGDLLVGENAVGHRAQQQFGDLSGRDSYRLPTRNAICGDRTNRARRMQ